LQRYDNEFEILKYSATSGCEVIQVVGVVVLPVFTGTGKPLSSIRVSTVRMLRHVWWKFGLRGVPRSYLWRSWVDTLV